MSTTPIEVAIEAAITRLARATATASIADPGDEMTQATAEVDEKRGTSFCAFVLWRQAA